MDLQSQIKDGFEKVQNEFHTFKQENDKRLELLDKKGSVPGDIEAKIDKHSAAIDTLVEKLEKTQAAMNRTTTNQNPEKDEKAVAKKMNEIFNAKIRGRATAEDMKFYNENIPAEHKTLSVGDDTQGGWFVRPEVSGMISQKVFESSPMRQLASSIVIGSDAWEEPADYSEVGTENAGETSSHTATTNMTFSMIRIPVHQMQAKPAATLKLLEDAVVDMESYLSGKAAEKFARDEATDFIAGTGVNESKGILSYTSGDGFDKIEQVASTVSGSFAGDDFISIQNSLFEVFQPNAKWLMKRATCTAARKLKDGNGRYLLSMEGNLKDGYQQILLGQPLIYANDMQSLSGSNLAVAYGDFKQGYLIVDRLGMSILRDPYTSDNHIVWKFRKRVGGGVHQFQAIKLMSILA